jgi:hypothetical protein
MLNDDMVKPQYRITFNKNMLATKLGPPLLSRLSITLIEVGVHFHRDASQLHDLQLYIGIEAYLSQHHAITSATQELEN